jgi:hypothetical protein
MVEEIQNAGQGSAPPSMATAITVGCLVGTVVSLVGVVVTMRLLDVEWGSAIGLGFFVAFWGGLGFGSMVGGVVHADRLERLAAAGGGHDRG